VLFKTNYYAYLFASITVWDFEVK